VAVFRRALRIVLLALFAIFALVAVFVGFAVWSFSSVRTAPPKLSGTFTKGSILVHGTTRSYHTYVPRDLPKGAPLVVMLHGSGESGLQVRTETGYGFDRAADAHGFALVYPDALAGDWDVCSEVGRLSPRLDFIDDVAFVTQLADTLMAEVGVDPRRVFAAGVSRGGALAIRLALEAPDRVRAVAAVSASVPAPENFRCKPTDHTSSVLIMNGTDDPLHPFDGGDVSLFGLFYKNGRMLSSRASGQYFADLNHIGGPPVTLPVTKEDAAGEGVRVERVQWGSGHDPDVELVAIHGGGHGLPQPYQRRAPVLGSLVLGPLPAEPNGPELIWAFFDRQRR
jgi:polyhydroxybutyrate depolymerase